MNKIWTIFETVDIETGEIIPKWRDVKKDYIKINETIKYKTNEHGQTFKQVTREVKHNGQLNIFDRI